MFELISFVSHLAEVQELGFLFWFRLASCLYNEYIAYDVEKCAHIRFVVEPVIPRHKKYKSYESDKCKTVQRKLQMGRRSVVKEAG